MATAMTGGAGCWLAALDGGLCRARGAREYWRCCRLVRASSDPRRPCPRLGKGRPPSSAGDRGAEDPEDETAAARNLPEANAILPGPKAKDFEQELGVSNVDQNLEIFLGEDMNDLVQRRPSLPLSLLPGMLDHSWSFAESSSPNPPQKLNDQELQAISELRSLLEAAGMKDLPNDLLHNCCKISGNNAARAFTRARDLFEWRQREGVDHILTDPVACAREIFWRSMLHYGLPGCDCKGRPVMIQALGRWDMKALLVAMRERKAELLRSHVVLYETLRMQAAEALLLATPADSTSRGQAARGRHGAQVWRPLRWVIVLDVEGLSLWHTKSPEVLACHKEVSKAVSKYYPGAIERVFIVNASSGFHLIWRAISRFIKPNTRAKVHILPEGDCRELVAECGAACIPQQFGGQLPAHTLPCITA